MQRWFDGPAWEMPEQWKSEEGQPLATGLSGNQCDENTVKMSWAMGFDRCQIAVRRAESALTTPNAINRLKSLLQKVGWEKSRVVSLGSPALSAREIDASAQVNYAILGAPSDTLDDMYGALGVATLKVGVAGRTFSKADSVTQRIRNYFQVEHIGFYIRDHYDFNGIQFLGIWTEDRVLTKQEMVRAALPSARSIYNWTTEEFALARNNDFRKYREKTGMGGDFVIYSDVFWKKSNMVIELGDAP